MNARLTLVILAVADLPRAIGFYSAVFAWKQTVDVPVYAEFQAPGGMRFGLYDRRAFAANTGQVPHEIPSGALCPTELYVHVDDLPAAITRLEAAGARCLSACAPRDWGDDAAYFADRDGNVVVVARPSTA